MSAINKFNEFIKYNEVGKSKFTHTSHAGGKYYLEYPEIDEFYRLYVDELDKGRKMHFIEYHRDQSHVIVDFDFKQETHSRIYTHDMIEKCCNIILDTLKIYVVVDNPLCILLEKPGPRPDKKNYKDGVHIVFPYIVTKPNIQFIVRNKAMPLIEKVLDGKYLNNIEDIYDEAVIQKNGWFLLGSKKKDEKYAWEITKVWNKGDFRLKKQTLYDMVMLLSIREKFDCNKINPDKIEEIKSFNAGACLPHSPPLTFSHLVGEGGVTPSLEPKFNIDDKNLDSNKLKNNITINPLFSDPDRSLVQNLVDLLSDKRCDNYNKWIEIGMCLKNINPDYLDIWEEWSNRSSKHVLGECANKWKSFNENGGLTIGTLKMLAKQDDPERYNEIDKTTIVQLFNKTLNAKPVPMGKLIYHLYYGKFIVTKPNKHLEWYLFDKHKWSPCNDFKLRNILTKDIANLFKEKKKENFNILSQLNKNKEQISQNIESAKVKNADCVELEKNAKNINENIDAKTKIGVSISKVIQLLDTTAYLDNVIKEAASFFSINREDFLDKINEKNIY
jgi:hypothetical protein